MSAMTTTRGPGARGAGMVQGQTVLGIVLAAIGAIVLGAFLVPDFSRYQMLAIAGVTFVAFVVTRDFGFAIPAAITGGIGTGVLLAATATDAGTPAGASFMLSMAAGFLAVWILGLFASPAERHPWPLIPAVIIGTVGFAVGTGTTQAFDWLQVGGAVALVVAGLIAIVRRRPAQA